MFEADWYVWVWGHNQLVISLADSQVHLNRWRGSANYRRSFSRKPDLLVSQNPKVVRRQPGSSLIGGNRGPSSTSESESIDKFKSQLLLRAHWSVSFRKLFGNNQTLTRLVETGDLQPLQNLNQLTDLNLAYCKNLIGQSVSEFVREQQGSSLIG